MDNPHVLLLAITALVAHEIPVSFVIAATSQLLSTRAFKLTF